VSETTETTEGPPLPGRGGDLRAWLEAQPPVPLMADKIAEWREQTGGPEGAARHAQGLSALQRELLLELRRRYEATVETQRRALERGDSQTGLHAVGTQGSASWRRGADWRDLRPKARPSWGGEYAETKPAAERAAVSRAWRRLEQRGLVERVNDAPEWGMHPRARAIALTPEGWAATDHLVSLRPTNG
jgi:hypothetical protein